MSIGPWQPFWIGEPERHLYAALHRPESAQPHLGVLLVPPLLHEQPRARRFLTDVASAFAANGIAALRFDFFGSGDSAGDAAQMRLTTLREDLECASSALRAHAGVTDVVVIAWRAGALAAWDWLHHGGAASLLVLWEPIRDGRDWLTELERADADERVSPERYTARRPMRSDASDGQLMGYAVAPALREAIAEVSIVTVDRPVWLLDRSAPGAGAGSRIAPARHVVLSDDAPQFGGSTRMDESLFMTPRMEQFVSELALALSGGG